MTNRFMVSVAALALIAGTGFANAQGMSKEFGRRRWRRRRRDAALCAVRHVGRAVAVGHAYGHVKVGSQ